MNAVFLGIGTNLGNKEKNLKEAIAGIEKQLGKVEESSSVYATEPWGFMAEDEFLNMVIKVETTLTPSELIRRIQLLESISGRVRTSNQYSSRIIDIDILFYGDQVINETSLIIPHPLLHKRKFVLIPLCEIEPDLVHPVLKETASSLLRSCNDQSNVRKYGSTI